MCVTIDGVWIDEWIYWPLTPLGTTSNYSATASDSIVSAETYLLSRCLETAVCLFAYCIATALLVRFEVCAQQRVFTPQYMCVYVYICNIYCTMLGVTWSLMNPNCTCYSTEDAVRIGNIFIYNPNHTSLPPLTIIYYAAARLHNYNSTRS
jgi:hypothetical protein